MRHLAVAAPTILSGAGGPAVGPHPWRFVSGDMIIALPPGSRSLLLAGKAHEAVELRAETLDGRPIWRGSAKGAFDLSIHTSETLLRLVANIARPDCDTGSMLRLQINRIAVDFGHVEREGDLWASAPGILSALGIGSARVPLAFGQKIAPVCGETADLVTRRLTHAGELVALGRTAFAEALRVLGERIDPKARFRAFDGTSIEGGSDAAARLSEDEFGLLFNPREAEALARRHGVEGSILILAETLNGETLRLSQALAESLAGAGDGRRVALMTPDGPPEEPRAEAVAKALASVILLQPMPVRETIACLAVASFVVVRGDPLLFGRVPVLATTGSTPAAVWRTGETVAQDPFAGLTSVSTVAEILALLSQKATLGEERADDPFAEEPRMQGERRFEAA